MKTRDRLRDLARGHPLLVDGALAALVLLLSLPPFTSLRSGHQALATVLIAATACPLAWRRRAPFAVLLVITVPGVLQIFTGQPITDYLAFLVAFYTVAVCCRPLLIVIATALLEAGAAFAVIWMPVSASHAVLVWVYASGLLAIAGLLGYYVRATRLAQARAQAERVAQQERERAHQEQLAVSAERARIAREMHDIVAHNIAVMIALAEGASATSARDPGQAQGLMTQVSATGRTALTEMRRLLGVLREPVGAEHAPQPALADLDELLATFRSAGLVATLTVDGPACPLPPSAELAVYRITTEALTNTLKHAPGARAEVDLGFRPDEVTVTVTDDGTVRKAVAAPDGVGHGLAGMRERAAVFGGDVSAGPRPGGGWQVRAVLRVEPGTEVSPADDDLTTVEGTTDRP